MNRNQVSDRILTSTLQSVRKKRRKRQRLHKTIIIAITLTPTLLFVHHSIQEIPPIANKSINPTNTKSVEIKQGNSDSTAAPMMTFVSQAEIEKELDKLSHATIYFPDSEPYVMVFNH